MNELRSAIVDIIKESKETVVGNMSDTMSGQISDGVSEPTADVTDAEKEAKTGERMGMDDFDADDMNPESYEVNADESVVHGKDVHFNPLRAKEIEGHRIAVFVDKVPGEEPEDAFVGPMELYGSNDMDDEVGEIQLTGPEDEEGAKQGEVISVDVIDTPPEEFEDLYPMGYTMVQVKWDDPALGTSYFVFDSYVDVRIVD